MIYSVKQAAERTQLPPSTLRYYDKEGLMPLLQRTPSGARKYSDVDIHWLELICCLKNSGMPLEEVKQFMTLCLQGSITCEQRKEILEEHKKSIEQQMALLSRSLKTINYKLEHYDEIGIFHIDSP